MAGRSWMLVLGLILVAVALVGLVVGTYLAARPGSQRTARGRWAYRTPVEFESNGERIYYTARSDSGQPITFTGGPHWLQMHGGSCVNCHGPGGRGGILVPMTREVAPDIRYGTLTSGEHPEPGEAAHPPYTEALIKRAIAEGLDPAGEPLSIGMPRWRMTEPDLDDLVEYLKALDGRGTVGGTRRAQ